MTNYTPYPGNYSVPIRLPDTTQSIASVVLIGVSAVLSIVCNILNLVILPSVPEINDASQIIYAFLSVADLLTGILLIPMAIAASKNEWPFGKVLCQTLGYLLTITTGLSSCAVFFLNGDRFLAVTRPLRYPSYVNRQRVIVMTVSNFVGSLVVMFFILYFAGDRFNIVIYREFGICMVDFSEPYFAPYTIVSFAVSMWAYAILILVFYAIMMRIVKRHRRDIDNQNNAVVSTIGLSGAPKGDERVVSTQRRATWANFLQIHTTTSKQSAPEKRARLAGRSTQRGRFKSIVLTLSMAGAFYVAWLPFTICEAVGALRGERVDKRYMVVASRLTLCNSWLNTVIYMMLKASYRKALSRYAKSMRAWCCSSSTVQDIHISPS